MMNKQQLGLTDDQEPIIALCTPRGSGALALLRVSGTGAIEVVDRLSRLGAGKKLIDCPTHTIHFGSIVDPESKTTVDEVLFFLMRGPKTFTGDDTVEISCHNNQFIIENIIALANKHGARLARAGEFSKRAFLNGKLDLVQAEAIQDVINAQTEEALRRSMEQLKGSLSCHLKGIETRLVKLLTLAEASFEFLEEEQRDMSMELVFKAESINLLVHLHELLSQFAQQQQVRQGVRVALVGRVNAGKSTLFNALVKKERAIVADVAGTTRDSIEASLYKGGIYWTFVDTAGLRRTQDAIEQQGIDRTIAEAQAADVVLLVFDAAIPVDDHDRAVYAQLIHEYAKKIIIIFNKIDSHHTHFIASLPAWGVDIPCMKVSALEKKGIESLGVMIDEKIQALFAQLHSPYLLTQRQARLISEIEGKLDFIVKSFPDVLHYELIAYHLKESLEKIAELTGRNVTERMLDAVFNDFCVGK